MTNQEIRKIDILRNRGFGYTKIANELNISVNSVKSYMTRHPKDPDKCLFCGKAIEQTEGKRERKYCSNSCRSKWWNQHRYDHPLGKNQQHLCPQCGKAFQGYGKRKYCSVVCALEGRRHRNA